MEPMAHEVPLRIALVRPPPGGGWAVQSGREDLIEPSESSDAMIAFDLSLRIRAPRADSQPSLLGPVTQGPPSDRFGYVNSGTRAGQAGSCWDRPAKVPLTGITRQLIERVRQQHGAGWKPGSPARPRTAVLRAQRSRCWRVAGESLPPPDRECAFS
jgi:hypothetical protein